MQNADITLDNVVVPDFFKLANANSFRDTDKVLKVTRLAVAWQAVGQQLAAFEVARRYAMERSQFGRPIASFQLVQHQLVQILGNAVSSMGMMVRLSQLEDAGQAKDEQSALAKAFTTARMRESVALGRSILGGNGIVTDYRDGQGLRRRRGHLLLRGHARDQHPRHRPGDHGHLRDRLAHGAAAAPFVPRHPALPTGSRGSRTDGRRSITKSNGLT